MPDCRRCRQRCKLRQHCCACGEHHCSCCEHRCSAAALAAQTWPASLQCRRAGSERAVGAPQVRFAPAQSKLTAMELAATSPGMAASSIGVTRSSDAVRHCSDAARRSWFDVVLLWVLRAGALRRSSLEQCGGSLLSFRTSSEGAAWFITSGTSQGQGAVPCP